MQDIHVCLRCFKIRLITKSSHWKIWGDLLIDVIHETNIYNTCGVSSKYMGKPTLDRSLTLKATFIFLVILG